MKNKKLFEGVIQETIVQSDGEVRLSMDMHREEKGVDGHVLPILFWQKKFFWSAAFKPIVCQQFKCIM